jgi:RNA polymerase primary sigma factor
MMGSFVSPAARLGSSSAEEGAATWLVPPAGSTRSGHQGGRSPNQDREGDEARARRILGWKLEFVPDPSVEDAASVDEALGPVPGLSETVSPRSGRRPEGIPPDLASLGATPLLTPAQEAHLFRRMNALKRRAVRLRERIDPVRADPADLDQIEQLCGEALALKNWIIAANLRLVVAIARRSAGPSDDFFERVSDGYLAMIRAVDRFDHSRGFKFSTYASWAIMRDVGRKISQRWRRGSRYRSLSGHEETLAELSDPRSNEREQQSARKNVEAVVTRLLGCLSDRERRVLERRYGLDGEEAQTLERIGRELRISKERVRQIEVRAKTKLQEFARSRKIDPPLS